MTAALHMQGVTKKFGRISALDAFDLEVPHGSIFGLVGSNGAGKTTAMTVAFGLLHPNAGLINVLDSGPLCPATHTGRVALLPQDAAFPPHARVEELLRFYGRLQGVASSALPQALDEQLDWVHLQDRRHSPIRTLSHGMKRRLAIAQAFLGTPELILLDEPLNGLDPREAARVRELICQRRGRQAIVISSHHLADIEELCDHVAFIERGRLVRQDTLEAIIHRGHHLTYLVGDGALPMAAMAAALPDVTWTEESSPRCLRVTFPEKYSATQLNAIVLRTLLEAGVGILEVRRGTDLESEYLRLAPATPPALPPKYG